MKYLSIFIRVALLALGQSLDCHSASEVSLMDMGKSMYNHSIFLGIYCTCHIFSSYSSLLFLFARGTNTCFLIWPPESVIIVDRSYYKCICSTLAGNNIDNFWNVNFFLWNYQAGNRKCLKGTSFALIMKLNSKKLLCSNFQTSNGQKMTTSSGLVTFR